MAIRGYAYHPAVLTVQPGARVAFVNRDQTAHTVTQRGGALDTGTVAPGHRATLSFSKPGRYTFYCQFHPFMHLTVVVR